MCRVSQSIAIDGTLAVLDAMPFQMLGLTVSVQDQLITRINVPSASRGKGYGRIMLNERNGFHSHRSGYMLRMPA